MSTADRNRLGLGEWLRTGRYVVLAVLAAAPVVAARRAAAAAGALDDKNVEGWVRPPSIRVSGPDLPGPYDADQNLDQWRLGSFLCTPVEVGEPPPVELPSIEGRDEPRDGVLLRIRWSGSDESRRKEAES